MQLTYVYQQAIMKSIIFYTLTLEVNDNFKRLWVDHITCTG